MKVAVLRRRGVQIVAVPGRKGRISAAGLMTTLAARGVTALLVEGGAEIAADLLRAGLVDRLVWFVAPSILGADGIPAVGALGVDRADRALRLTDVEVARVGDDLVLTASVRRAKARRPFASAWPPR